MDVRVWLDKNKIPFIEFATRKFVAQKHKRDKALLCDIWNWIDGHTSIEWRFLMQYTIADEKTSEETCKAYKEMYHIKEPVNYNFRLEHTYSI